METNLATTPFYIWDFEQTPTQIHSLPLPNLHSYNVGSTCRLLNLLFSHQVVSDSLQPHRLWHAMILCPPLFLEVCSNSCSLSWWCCITISSSATTFSFCAQSFQHQGLSNEWTLHIRWPKYWSFSFSISPSNEYSELISFRIDWFDLLAAQDTLKNLLQHRNLKAFILQHSAFFMVQLSDYTLIYLS